MCQCRQSILLQDHHRDNHIWRTSHNLWHGLHTYILLDSLTWREGKRNASASVSHGKNPPRWSRSSPFFHYRLPRSGIHVMNAALHCHSVKYFAIGPVTENYYWAVSFPTALEMDHRVRLYTRLRNCLRRIWLLNVCPVELLQSQFSFHSFVTKCLSISL